MLSEPNLVYNVYCSFFCRINTCSVHSLLLECSGFNQSIYNVEWFA